MIWDLFRKRSAAIGPALLGKLPCQPDFVREGFRGPATDALDAFLVQASPLLHQGVGVGQLPTMFVSQVLPKQAHGLIGVVAPSVDAAGRPFPVAVVHALPQDQLRAVQSDAFWRFTDFLERAEALVGKLGRFTLEDARAELAALPTIAEEPAAMSGTGSPPPAAFERGLAKSHEGSPDPDAQSYALYVVASAFAARHPGLTLDFPAHDPSQARLWLTLSARVAEATSSALCILYAPTLGRLLIAIDAWHPNLLRAVADPGFSFDQLWPLGTPQAEARAHARSALAQAGPALARPRGVAVRELADQLALFSQALRS
jgi:type VI secretion system ImpM family protein